MTAKSVSELSRASKSTTNENRSVAAKNYSEIDKTKLSPKIREKYEKYQKTMQNANKTISRLFLDNETKNQIDEAYFISYQTGENLILQGSKNFTDDKTSDFFNKWTEMMDILENYFDFNPTERYTQFIDETTKKIIDVVQPLGNFVFEEKNMSETRKSRMKTKLETYQESFNDSIAILSKQTYKYFKGKLSISVITQTVKQLISNVTSFDNLFFHQTREDAKNILYQVHTHLNRILDSIYDYHADEQSITECDAHLSKITRRLKSLFNVRNQDDSYSDNEYEYEEEEEINEKSRKRPSDSTNNENSIKKKGKPRTNKNTPETESQLRLEISELKKSIKSINRQILSMKDPNSKSDDNSKADFSDLSFRSDYLKQIISHKKAFNEEMQKDLENLQAFNQELEDDSSKNRKIDQKTSSSTRKIKREIFDLDDELKTYTEELEKYRQISANPLKIRPQQSSKVDIRRAIIELEEQNKGLQSSIDDIKDQEEKLIEEEKEIGTANDPKNQVLFDMMNFIDSHRKEIREIENQLKNSEPIQKVKKISKELEAYRNDKFVTGINSEYLETRKQLDEARYAFNLSLSNLNDQIEYLLNSLNEETKSTHELYQIELSDKKSSKFIISHDTFCRVVKEKEIKHSLKNRLDMIDQWLFEKCPQYNKFDISTEEKLDLLKKAAESYSQRNQE